MTAVHTTTWKSVTASRKTAPWLATSVAMRSQTMWSPAPIECGWSLCPTALSIKLALQPIFSRVWISSCFYFRHRKRYCPPPKKITTPTDLSTKQGFLQWGGSNPFMQRAVHRFPNRVLHWLRNRLSLGFCLCGRKFCCCAWKLDFGLQGQLHEP